MHTINDDADSDDANVDLQEKYEKSVLAPLRRRLSDIGSSGSPIKTSPTTKLPFTSIFLSNASSKHNKENEDNTASNDCRTITIMSDIPSSALHVLPASETEATPDPPNQAQQTRKLKSCLSAPSNKKRRRSSLTTPSESENHMNSNPDDLFSPILEPPKKKNRYNNEVLNSMTLIKNEPTLDDTQIPSTSRKAVHFAPSSAVEYEVEVPVCQSLTPIPAETTVRRYPTEMKATTIEEMELIQMTKRNYAILKAFDNVYDSDNDIDRVKRRRKQKKDRAKQNRRKSFYIPSTQFSHGSDLNCDPVNDPLLHTV